MNERKKEKKNEERKNTHTHRIHWTMNEYADQTETHNIHYLMDEKRHVSTITQIIARFIASNDLKLRKLSKWSEKYNKIVLKKECE